MADPGDAYLSSGRRMRDGGLAGSVSFLECLRKDHLMLIGWEATFDSIEAQIVLWNFDLNGDLNWKRYYGNSLNDDRGYSILDNQQSFEVYYY